MLTLPGTGRPAHQQRGNPCSCGVRDRICPSALDVCSPDPACPQHQWFRAQACLATTPAHVLSLLHTLWLEGCFPHLNSLQGHASRQRHWAGQCQACMGCCKVLCNGGSNYLQNSLDVHQDATPSRGMAAAQPLTATRHNSLGQDVDESAVQAVSAVQGRGQSDPTLNPDTARGYHMPGADVQQDSSELMVNRRLGWHRV